MRKRLRKRLVHWLAWHLPRAVVRECAMRVLVAATTGRYRRSVVPEVRALEAIARWDWG